MVALLIFGPWRLVHLSPGVYLAVLAGVSLLVLLVLGLIAFMAISLVCWHWRNWTAPRRTVSAVVARKREHARDFSTALGGDDEGTTCQQWDFLVTFLVGECELELAVPEALYVDLEPGQTGLLTYKGERFLGFSPAAAAEPEGSVQPQPTQWRRGPRMSRRRRGP